MKKDRIIKLIALFIILISLPLSLLIYNATLPNVYTTSFYGELYPMFNKLKKTKSKKIILIGGSSVAFGVNSSLLENELKKNDYNYTVCNFGLYGAIGTRAMIELAKSTISKGDIILLAPEMIEQATSMYFNAETLWKSFDGHNELVFNLSNETQKIMLSNYPSYISNKNKIIKENVSFDTQGVYSSKSFNENCDMVFTREGNNMKLGYDYSSLVKFNISELHENFLNFVNDYNSYCNKRGATLLYSFAPVNKSSLQANDSIIQRYFDKLNSTLDCLIISSPFDHILDEGWFYDNNFHLNSPGSIVNTSIILDDLLRYLGSGENTITVPTVPPQSIYQEEVIISNDNDEDFIYQEVKKDDNIIAYKIKELSLKSKEKELIEIPTSYKGLPIISFSKSVFANNEIIKKLIIPSSIEVIEDGSFSGCLSLERIELLHEDLNNLAVGTNLFSGCTSANIYISRKAYNLLINQANCTWALYDERVFIK